MIVIIPVWDISGATPMMLNVEDGMTLEGHVMAHGFALGETEESIRKQMNALRVLLEHNEGNLH